MRYAATLEAYLRSGNKGGKTEAGAALAVSLLQGRRKLNGQTIKERLEGKDAPDVELPLLPMPCVGYLVVPGYKQSVDSAIKSLKTALGDWPHDIIYVQGEKRQTVESILVQPIGVNTEDRSKWSRLVVFVDKGQPPEGARIDFAWADEPPSEAVWREIRMRGKARSKFVRFITATPLERSRWEWLQSDFENTLNSPANGRVELQASVYDNEALSAADIAEQEALVKGDPFAKARLFGDYVDAEGGSPWGEAGWARLNDWNSKAWRGLEREYRILTEQDGLEYPSKATVEHFYPYEKDEVYYLTADLSRGVRDLDFDPGCIHLYACIRPRLVARFGCVVHDKMRGYVTAFSVGSLAAQLSISHGNAAVDPEMNSGYGESFLRGFRRSGGRQVALEYRSGVKDGSTESYGFSTTRSNRGLFVGGVQEALETNSVEIPSKEAISCLMGVRLDPSGKILATGRRKDEDMICLGRFQYARAVPGRIKLPRNNPKAPTGAWQAFVKATGIRVLPENLKQERRTPERFR